MLVSKKKHDLLIKNYNWLVDIKNDWEDSYNQMQSRAVRLEQQCNRLYKELDKLDDEVLDLTFERDTYKEKYKEWFQNFIKTKAELEKVDRIVLQYEQRINELEEQ
ncbi:hypothetical protein phiSHEF5_11 [Enterococcus phage phiSHEF5]|uniref:Uncharacterized protein n=1 Tax=Enterococcus phage phiSHEF5 TaxID=2030924 RepID=A0A249XUP4_9CAUD|nr:hypothetical protein FDI50_gp11 [Enterococcus phage phiSHEF5]ASZ75667.1 hypothetical protein phiSHEF5_11 [Enterococcus phage phiSHEF5]